MEHSKSEDELEKRRISAHRKSQSSGVNLSLPQTANPNDNNNNNNNNNKNAPSKDNPVSTVPMRDPLSPKNVVSLWKGKSKNSPVNIDDYIWEGLTLKKYQNHDSKVNVWTTLFQNSEGQTKSGPQPRSRCAMVLCNGKLTIFGGAQSIDAFKDIWTFDLTTNTWKETRIKSADLTSPPELYFHSAVEYNSSMLIFGGYEKNNSNSNRLFRFHLEEKTWEEVKTKGTPPSQRSGHVALVWKEQMIVFGGFDGKARLNDTYSLNLTTFEWSHCETEGEAPNGRMNFGACIFGKDMYVYSGHSGQTSTNDFFKLNLTTWEWTKIDSNNPGKRYGHTLIPTEESLILFGGSVSDNLEPDIFSYDPLLNKWAKIIPSQDIDGRTYHSAVYDPDERRMIIFGGTVYTSQQKSFTNRVLDFTFLPSPPPSCLQSDFKKLYEDGLLADFELISEDKKKFKTHRCILACRCGVLSLDLLSQKNSSELAVPVKSKSLEFMIEFLYTDKVMLEQIDYSELCDLIMVAKKYELERLALIAANQLCILLNLDNVLNVLQVAAKEKWTLIANACYSFVLHNYSQVVSSPDFALLPQEVLVNLIRIQQAKNIPQFKPEPIPEGTLVEDFASLFTELDYADFALNAQGTSLKCHKCILAARSEFFRALFKTNTRDSTKSEQEMIIGTYEPNKEATTCFLEFLYTDKLVGSNVQSAIYLLRVSSYFGLSNDKLFIIAASIIENNLSVDNILLALAAAHETENPGLKRALIKEIITHLPQISGSQTLDDLPPELLTEIIREVSNFMINNKLQHPK